MSESENTSYFMTAQPKEFGETVPADEKMHLGAKEEVDSPALVETNFIGFNVPEHNVHSLNYLWAHPNLGIVSGGAWAWQGFKSSQLEADLFNMHDFMPESVILDGGDMDDFTLPHGYGVEVIEPLEKLRIFYSDPSRKNEFDVTMTAVMPPAMIATGKHFDQAMKTEGKVVLRGKPFDVDGYTVRDRSWGEARPEDVREAPPIHWVTAIFSDDFAFHMTAIEDPETAAWKETYPDFPAEAAAAIGRGWVWVEGELRGLEETEVKTEWDLARGYARAHEIKMTDTSGREWTARGEIQAASEWHTWSNVRMAIALCRWECDGKTGWGDSQMPGWTDFVHGQLFK